MSRWFGHLNATFIRQRTSKQAEEHDGGAARHRHTVRRSALPGNREKTPGDCARMPVSRSAARDTRSCLPIRTQSRGRRREERVGWLGADDRLGVIGLLRLFTLVEQGLSQESRVALWQNWLTPCWKRIGGGCHLDRKNGRLDPLCRVQIDAVETGYMKVRNPGLSVSGFSSNSISVRLCGRWSGLPVVLCTRR
jgi:hypothetical protein